MSFLFDCFAVLQPAECPWGENWGNLVLLREKPQSAEVVQLPGATGKRFFFGSAANENRCMVHVVLADGTVFACTHLEDRDANLRQTQAEQITARLQEDREKSEQRTVFVGDLNEIHKPAYSEHELRVLRTFNYSGFPLPTASLSYLAEQGTGTLLTGDVKHASAFNKNLCHWLVSEPAGAAEGEGEVHPFYSPIGDHTLTFFVAQSATAEAK